MTEKRKEKIASYRGVFLLDLLISTVASLFALLLMRWVSDPFYGFQNYILIWLLLSALSSSASFFLLKTNRVVIRYSSFLSIGKLVLSSFVKEILLLTFLLLGIVPESPVQVSILSLSLDLLLTVFLLITVRLLILQVMKSAGTSMEEKIGMLRVMVFGTSHKSISTVSGLDLSSRYEIIGFITSEKENEGIVIFGKKVYCCDSKEKMLELCSRLGVEAVLFVEASSDSARAMASYCMESGVTILNFPRLENIVPHTLDQTAVRELNMNLDTAYIKDGMSTFGRTVKRLMDIVVASLCLIIFSPLFLVIYIAIKCEDGGAAIFRQERIGRFGRPFTIFKFRSMKLDAEAEGPALYAGEDDPRLTKVGAFIRSHHLDELPQLWNVFLGDMAFIGYRPERQYYINQILEKDYRYTYLYQMRPGVTSYATLFNGYTDTVEKMLKRLEYDLYYLRHRSIWFDWKILFMTFAGIVFGKKF